MNRPRGCNDAVQRVDLRARSIQVRFRRASEETAMRFALVVLVAVLTSCARPPDAANPEPARVEESDQGVFFQVSPKRDEAKLLVTLPKPGADGVMIRAIHAAGLTAGLGSNPVGFDRGSVEDGRILSFRLSGKKVIVEMENWTYRASSDDPLERRSVQNSFARSFLWASEVVEQRRDGAVVVDLAPFLIADTMDLRGRLKGAGQGAYTIAADRSFPDFDTVLAFPDNVELDAYVTFVSEAAGREVAATAADGRAFTLIVHHSFVRLPDDGYKTREFDPRVGAIDVPYYDFSAPLDAPLQNAFARRFRLERIDPALSSGLVKKPIVFYVDRGAPEPVRSALIDGASWWREAFEAAGFEDAFRVELLPEGVHPMDARYNVIQWVHRQTRGWSYGGGIYDPRTGEMIRAAVILGSQRVRQDRMIFEGLAGAEKTGSGEPDDPIQLSLQRIRQLSAHEVGHPLGFAHNFAASVNERASVMDYPAPFVRPTTDGRLDFSNAYSSGVGAWDVAAVKWLYSEFAPEADERAELEKIVRETSSAGLRFVDDPQGRDVSGAHPAGSVWDNGSDPVATLRETLRVREIALGNFGERSLKEGRSLSDLRNVLVPIYLYHRYQLAAAAKLIGGYDFRYETRGGAPSSAGVATPPDRQRDALSALLETLDVSKLDLPDSVIDRLPPPLASFGDGAGSREMFASEMGPVFDILSAADAAGSETFRALLSPRRLARLVEMERRDPAALTVPELLLAIDRVLFSGAVTPRQAEIQRTLQTRFVSMLIDISSDIGAGGEAQAAAVGLGGGGGVVSSAPVQARVETYLRGLRARLALGQSADASHRVWLGARIEAHLARPAATRRVAQPSASVPPGPPIGGANTEDCWFCDLP